MIFHRIRSCKLQVVTAGCRTDNKIRDPVLPREWPYAVDAQRLGGRNDSYPRRFYSCSGENRLSMAYLISSDAFAAVIR
jgi:hypothetical protein